MNPHEDQLESATNTQTYESSLPPQFGLRSNNVTSGLGVTMNLGFGSSLPGQKGAEEKRFPIPDTRISEKDRPPKCSPGIIYFLWRAEGEVFSLSKMPSFDYKICPEFKEEFLKGKFDKMELVRVIDRLRYCPSYHLMTQKMFGNMKMAIISLAVNAVIVIPCLAYLGFKMENTPFLQNLLYILFLILLGVGGYFSYQAYEELEMRKITRTKEFKKVLDAENEQFEREDEESNGGGIVRFVYRPEGHWKEIYALIGEDPVVQLQGQPNIAGREIELQRLQEQLGQEDGSERGGEEADEPQYTEQRQLKEDSGSEEEGENEVSYRDDSDQSRSDRSRDSNRSESGSDEKEKKERKDSKEKKE